MSEKNEIEYPNLNPLIRTMADEVWAMEPLACADMFHQLETAARNAGGKLPAYLKKLVNPHVETIGPVAVLNIRGPIFRYSSVLTRLFRATCLEDLAKDLRASIDDPAVKSILLNVDSAGGEIKGIHEVAEMIHQARAKKPVVAYVGGTSAAGAYWLASAAETIVIDATAQVGSIGISAVFMDSREAWKKAGIERIQILSTASPKKRPDPATKDGATQIRDRIDRLVEVFISSVAKHRGVTAETVRKDFGQGDILIGANAVKAGLADRLGSFQSVLEELKAGKFKQAEKQAEKPETQAIEQKTKDERKEEMAKIENQEALRLAKALAEEKRAEEELVNIMASAGDYRAHETVLPGEESSEQETMKVEGDPILKAMVEGGSSIRYGNRS